MRRTSTILVVLYWCVWASCEDQPLQEPAPSTKPVSTNSSSVETAPLAPECDVDQACPSNKGCVAQKCVDLCVGKPCGNNALCQVHDHHAACVCAEGYYGDAVAGCLKQEPECESDEKCEPGMACVKNNCVAKVCVGKECAAGAMCVDEKGVPTCVCRLGLIGDGTKECVEPLDESSRFGSSTQQAGSRGDAFCKGNRFPKPLGKKVYHVVTNIKANWYNAYMYCKAHGHRLATVESKEENNLILEAINESAVRNGNFFIAGNDHSMEERWFWMTTGLPVTKFTYWHSGRPTCHTALNCMAYTELDYPSGNVGYRWYDRLCYAETHNFICEDYV